ncbi:MAG: hypothetical protein K8S98_01970, partial [Planctomycetes bacterium]|nr:hypothetical protein [Planctomycetota bacterium]
MRTLALTLTSLTLGAAPALAFDGGTDGAVNHPPVCNSNGPYVFEANNTPGTTTTDIVFSSAGTFDPDGDALTYFWFEECPVAFFVDPTSATPTMTVDMAGQCSVTCKFELRVFANGQSAKCFDQFTVQDTLPPVLTVPPDLNLIYGDDTTIGATGTATATDNADPAPVVTYSDVYTPNPIPNGFEGVITRTWTATDYCGHVT